MPLPPEDPEPPGTVVLVVVDVDVVDVDVVDVVDVDVVVVEGEVEVDVDLGGLPDPPELVSQVICACRKAAADACMSPSSPCWSATTAC